MKPSKYLNVFKTVEGSADLEIYGDALLVEKIDEEMVKELGNGVKIYLAEAKSHKDSLAQDKPVFVHVLAVGKGFYNEAGEDVAVTVQPGDIILVGQFSVKWFSHLEVEKYGAHEIGLTRESEVQMRFKGLEGYERYFSTINKTIKGEV